MNKNRRKQNILTLIAISLLVVAIFHSIFVDGIRVAILIMFPYSLLILIVTIISVIRGYKNRKEYAPWYFHSLVILLSGILVLWTPVLKHSRTIVERNWRWNSRREVVEDIKSGKLPPYAGPERNNILMPLENYGRVNSDENSDLKTFYVLIPFEKYGRVSFGEVQGHDNAVLVEVTPETGTMVRFTTNAGFFGQESQLLYIEKAGENNMNPYFNRINNNWFSYDESNLPGN